MLALGACSCLSARAAALPPPVIPLIPQGYEVSLARAADFNRNGRADLVVVLSEVPAPSAPGPSTTGAKRLLMVLLQTPEGRYTLAGKNTEVAMSQAEGHPCDPRLDSGGLAAKGRFVTVENSMACGQHWTDYITFRHEPTLSRFVFHKRIVETWRLNPSTSSGAPALVLGHRKVTEKAQDKPILLDAYRIPP